MTLRDFLSARRMKVAELAAHLKVHVSQVYRWRARQTVPEAEQFAELVKMSGGLINYEDMAPIKDEPAPSLEEKHGGEAA